MTPLENIVLTVSLFISAVLVVFIIAKYNYLIRKAMIEKGNEVDKRKMNYLDIGCIVLGVGIGLGISSVFTVMDLSEDTMDLLIYSVILICGGLGLVTAHLIRTKYEKGE